MSRIIKGALYEDEPKIVTVPVDLFRTAEAEEEAQTGFIDAEAQENMLAAIRQKEDAAAQLLKDAKIQAEIIRQEAHAEADKLLLDARAQVETLQEEARQKGYEQGVEEGRQAGAEQIAQEQHHILVEGNARAERTLQEAQTACQDYVTAAENTIAEMVMRIADKVLPKHFIDVPQLILPLVSEAIRKVKDQPHVLVRVPPESYELVMMAQTELQNQLEGSAVLEVKSDEAMQLGDCVVESPNGVVDAKLSTQLELVKQAIRNVMK